MQNIIHKGDTKENFTKGIQKNYKRMILQREYKKNTKESFTKVLQKNYKIKHGATHPRSNLQIKTTWRDRPFRPSPQKIMARLSPAGLHKKIMARPLGQPKAGPRGRPLRNRFTTPLRNYKRNHDMRPQPPWPPHKES